MKVWNVTGRNVTFGLQGPGVKKPVWCPSDVEVRKVGAAELRESRRPKNEDQLSFGDARQFLWLF